MLLWIKIVMVNVIIKYSKPTNTKNVIIHHSTKIYTDDASVIGKVVEPSQDNNIITSDTTFSNSVNTSLQFSISRAHWDSGTRQSMSLELLSFHKGINLDSPNLDFNLTPKVKQIIKPSLKFSMEDFMKFFPKIQRHNLNHIEETIIRNSLGMTLQSNLVYSL